MDREVIPGQDGRGPSLYPTLAPRMLKNHIFLSLCLTFLILRIHLGGEAMTGYLEILKILILGRLTQDKTTI